MIEFSDTYTSELRGVALILSVLLPWVIGISRQHRPTTELDAVLLLLQGCLSKISTTMNERDIKHYQVIQKDMFGYK